MSRNIKSVKLMELLRPFMQLKILSAAESQNIVLAYRTGNDVPAMELINSPDVPYSLGKVCKDIAELLGV